MQEISYSEYCSTKEDTGNRAQPLDGAWTQQETINLSMERGQSNALQIESPLPDLNWGHPDVC